MNQPVSRRSVLRGAGLVAAGAAATAVAPQTARAATAAVVNGPASATRATDFLGSLGVCTHIGQGIDAAEGVAGALTYLGVNNIRDDANLTAVQNWITLHKLSGARVNLIAQSDSVTATIQIAEQLAAAGALMSVEGPNEPNNQPVTYNGQTSDHATDFLPVAYYARDLYRRVRTDRALQGIPVFASSEAGGSEPNNVGLQFLTIPHNAGTLMPDGTAYADFANTHTYPDRAPGWVDNLAWNVADPTLNGAWDGLHVEFGHTWYGGFDGYPDNQLAKLPRVMTETGWATEGSGSITDDQQGRLILCLYLANFTRQWKNTFIYMLRDDPAQGYWGLVDTDYNPKPSGNYVRNLTTILADDRKPTRAMTARLTYSIPDKPQTVHDVLMQKSNGELYLIVWNEQADSASDISVTFDGPPHRVSVYNPMTGSTPEQTLPSARSLDLTLTNYDCRVLKIS
jgi:hypothetical protein